MKNRTLFLILVFYVPTVLWGILGFFVYLSTIQNYSFLKNAGFLEILFTSSLLVRLLVLSASYFLAISIGLVFYAEKNIWSDE